MSFAKVCPSVVDEITPVTLPVFATFVYYRALQAVPSLIRSWWESCKNRQLSMAVASFTSRHFSPVLIAHELAHLRDPNDPAGKALRDNEDFTVKVTSGSRCPKRRASPQSPTTGSGGKTN